MNDSDGGAGHGAERQHVVTLQDEVAMQHELNNMLKLRFPEIDRLMDDDLELILHDVTHPDNGWICIYDFRMMHRLHDIELGTMELRDGAERLVANAGHIAYEVHPEHRGNHYAARACMLLLPVARTIGLTSLRITCRPENAPSRRTCELIGAQLLDVVDLTEETDMYQRGYRRICRYHLQL